MKTKPLKKVWERFSQELFFKMSINFEGIKLELEQYNIHLNDSYKAHAI